MGKQRILKSVLNFLVSLASLIIFLIFFEFLCRFFWEYYPADLLNPPGTETIQNSPEFSVKIKINDNGLRDGNYPFKKEKDAFRIVVIGDSMTFGWGVEADGSYPKVLERMLNKVDSNKKFEVINISKLGSGPLRFSQFLEFMGLKYHPDLVIVTFFPGNDLNDDLKTPIKSGFFYTIESFCKRNFYSYFFILSKIQHLGARFKNKKQTERILDPFNDEHLRLIAKKANVSFDVIKERLKKVDKKKIDNAISCYNKGNDYFLFLLEVFLTNPSILREQYNLSSPKWKAAWERNKMAYRKIRDLCLKNGVKILILLVPAPFQVNEFYLSEWRKCGVDLDDAILKRSKAQSEMENFCLSEGILLLDLFKAFKDDTKGQYYYVEDGHWNKEGHQFAAQVIYKRLKNDGVVF